MPTLREVAETLLYRYAAVIDDGDLADWPGFFAEDAEYKLIPRENFVRGMAAALIWCKSRAMMRDRAIAIKKASIYTPHYYRHHYSNVIVERGAPSSVPSGPPSGMVQVTLRANYLVCRTQDDGDTIIFSTGRVVASLSIPDDPAFSVGYPPSSLTPKSDPNIVEVPPSRDSSPPSFMPHTVRVGFSPGPPSRPPRSISYGPPSMYGPPSVGPRSIAPGSTLDPALLLPPPSRRRQPQSPIFLSMTVIYDTCRIPGLLVFPI